MRIGPYEVLAELGRGGMGVVYSARSPEGTRVAIKVLRKNEAEVVVRFERERRLLGSLGEAEGFVPLLDAGTTPGGPYIVMPFVSGGTLRKKLEAGPLAADETAKLGRALAAALGAAHARGIVHRDMKPENVLFTADGRPLVADLGLAKHFDPGAPGASQSVSLSMKGTLRGTAGYMAREQMADAKSVGPAADVFSLGVILYECLAGEPPFVADSFFELLAKVSSGHFEPIGLRNRAVPPWLGGAIETALAPAAWDRFPDGYAFERALAGRDRVGPRHHLAWRWWLLAVSGALASAAGVLVLASRSWQGSSHAAGSPPGASPSECVERAEVALDRKELDLAIAECTSAIALDPRLAVAFFDRGSGRDARGARDAALADYERFLELAPADARASEVEARIGELRDAAADEADRTVIPAIQSLCETADGELRAKSYESALASYEDASRRLEKSAAHEEFKRQVGQVLHYNWACCLSRVGKKDDALKELTIAIGSGYKAWEAIESDDDLAAIRQEEGYRKAIDDGKAAEKAALAAEDEKKLPERVRTSIAGKPIFALDFDVETFDGKRIGNRDLEGKAVIVHFFNALSLTTEGHVMSRDLPEIAHLLELYDRYHAQGLEIVGIGHFAFGRGHDEQRVRDIVSQFVENHRLPWSIVPVSYDDRLWRLSGRERLTFALLDRSGKVRGKASALSSYEPLEEAVRLLLDTKAKVAAQPPRRAGGRLPGGRHRVTFPGPRR
jgi:tetratricopeptide (TPR) repeat protein/predicted Ser/Thr protein kinase